MKIRAWLRSLLARLSGHSEIEEELRSHMQHRADDLERSGLDRAQAERRARIEFGPQVRFEEECREELVGTFLDTLLHDARFALRVLRKSPGFAVTAISTLALAVGANSVVFGVLNGLILRPLNVPQIESLWGSVYGQNPGWQSYPNYVDLRNRSHSFEDLAAFNFAFVALDTGNNPSSAAGFSTTGNYFDVLRLRPYLGRFYHGRDEHGPNSAPYLVLSYAYWHSHFSDDRTVVGRVIRLNKHPFTVVGIAPPGFRGTESFISIDFFMPIVDQEEVDGEKFLDVRENTKGLFEMFGHLKPGVTPAQAAADLNAIGADLEKTYPKEFHQKNVALAHPGLTAFGGTATAFMAALMLLAFLILLAACANLGGLFAAHTADRSRELALRLALGSSRGRILRQLLTEAVLVSLAGGAVGLLGSVLLLGRLSEWQPFAGAPIHLPVTPDARLYAMAFFLALVSGFLFGIVPVRQVLKTDPYEIIKSGTKIVDAGPGSRSGRRVTVRDGLLVVQIAICAVLVTSSLVAVRGLARSLSANLGFDTRNTVLAGTNLAMAGYHGSQTPILQRRIIDALKTIPGVEHVGLVNNYPPLVYTAAFRTNVFRKGTKELTPRNIALTPYLYEVSPDYFAAAGTALLAGRDFSWHDEQDAPRAALVNRQFAEKIFGSVAETPGRYFTLQDGALVQVIGVVENGKYLSLTEEQQPAMFLPFVPSPASLSHVIVRLTALAASSRRDPQQAAAAVRSKVRELDAGLLVDTESWTSKLSVVLFPARVATMSLGVLGTIGAVLSITGIFGLAAYSVSRRLKELGIRVALGAQRREVLESALGRVCRVLAVGSIAGLLLGIAASRVLSAIVYQATPRDPLVLTGVVLAMALLGLVATWIPAQRALSLDPGKLLREE